ncbi:HNH endonuclease signature motif containing protein [Nocardioides sp. R-C-SC26]|uniref:HNH endonuclease signature motif containing protein n=1 Tax=Nocardioides sp. R-C-SC26 TaxID=2870414 RepID=UPI0035AC03D5
MRLHWPRGPRCGTFAAGAVLPDQALRCPQRPGPVQFPGQAPVIDGDHQGGCHPTGTRHRRAVETFEAGIVPAVLGGRSQVLDLGRKTRFHTPTQRLALMVERRTCEHPTCQVPASGCHIHHEQPWRHGGPTSLANAQVLCPRHHTLAHRDPPRRT